MTELRFLLCDYFSGDSASYKSLPSTGRKKAVCYPRQKALLGLLLDYVSSYQFGAQRLVYD